MVEHPDNANLPVVNRAETVLGCTISFLIVACLAVSLRLYIRFRERLWGWDDLFVLFAGLSTIAGSCIVCLMPDSGMGKHIWTLDNGHLEEYFKWVWSSNVTYTSSTTFIKLAILFQYLRLFDMQSTIARRLSKCMIVFISCWGITFFCLALFSCIPIKKNWDFRIPGKCVAWGSKDGDVLFASFAAHSASNMLLDILCLILPVPFLKSLRMKGRTRMGLWGLFTMGSIVAILSVARMFVLSISRAGTVPVFDPTFAAPAVFVFSVLEVNIAILCASIPTFWPFVTSLAANKILVVNEIEVRTDRRESTAFVENRHSNSGFVGIPELEQSGGRVSRMSIVMGGKGGMERSTSRSAKLHKHKPSKASSHSTAAIELGRRMSQESDRNLARQTSGTSLSSSPGHDGVMEPTRSASLGSQNQGHGQGGERHYQDRYLQEWAFPDFDKQGASGGRGNTYANMTTTVERAQIPYDHIKALEK
ncbi:uncharacterized protein BDR25DRAFT_298639 [Lindgomyces ingoldianus]|uniref:Uncharacterized protein n=1 Tax=Lindgomyces ingoldianus TaxID=673940 RepID=A0ACB6QAD3_9PLEO|nr:uncharacterized protein BDR25DRAFT_298639 [Lindgomyces ingoldianus]KAF2463101.1 hypothetical protein BDR25DRAFT_298639 [Lindgomyces ingoldianus]